MDLVREICRVCDFYRETDEGLECGAYKILRILVRDKIVSVEDIRIASGEISREVSGIEG